MGEENAEEQSRPQAEPSPAVGAATPRAGKLRRAILGVGCVVVLVAASPYFIKAARSHWDRIAQPLSEPPAIPHVNLPATATERPTTIAAPQETTLSSEELAQKIWAEFDETMWGAPFEAWSSLHSNRSCKPFRGNTWGPGADRQWSHRCSTGSQAEAAHWSFYVFGLEEPLVPRLEQFDVFTVALPQEKLAAVQNTLQGRLVARFGPGEDRSPKVVAIRRVPWPQYQRWQTADVEIYLSLSEFNPQTNEGRLQLQARQRPLLEALKEDERLRLVGVTISWYEVGSGTDKQLADDLRADFPDAAMFLVKQQPDPPPPDPEKVHQAVQRLQAQIRTAQAQAGSQAQLQPRAAIALGAIAGPPTHWKVEDFQAALVKLLSSVQTFPRERQPEILLAADRLAWRLPQIMQSDKSQAGRRPEWQAQLAKFGVTYEESAIGAEENSWVYTGRLLERVWTDYGDTDWGERAFLVLLLNGWNTNVDCRATTDSFRIVILRGLEFQKTHANSKYLPDVQMAVAQAYETWWSLSQASTGEEADHEEIDVRPEKYREGAEEARQKAIALYEQFLQAAPQSDDAAYARRVLPRLKLGLDTGQRRYYCFIWD